MLQQLTSLRVLRLATLLVLTTAHPMSANADVFLSQNGQFRNCLGGVPPIDGPQTYTVDVSLGPTGFVRLYQFQIDSRLTVDGGLTLFSPRGLETFSFPGHADKRADFLVDGVGSRIVIGGDAGGTSCGAVGTGNIVLQGKGDFLIANGGSVSWDMDNSCDHDREPCDILIGANNPFTSNIFGVTNFGITVEGPGSLLDASNTNGGRLWVGFTLAEFLGQSDDFLVVRDGGVILSNGAGIAHGWEQEGSWVPANGYLRGLSLVDDGYWHIQAADGEGSNLNIGEGDGASGLLAIINGGVVEVAGNPGADTGFFLGQSAEGSPTTGADNLLIVSGDGSRLSIDNNFEAFSGSRIANGAVSIQDQGVLELDSSVLLVSGKTGRAVTSYFSQVAASVGITSLPTFQALEVVSDGSLTITDEDSLGISALIIGQTPDAGPTQEAHVFVDGTITVINDDGLDKIPLDETVFGIPVVSNIGTGSLTIANSGVVEFQNGDFVIGVGVNDDAHVTVVAGGQLTAERVVVGWADIDMVGPGDSTAETGELILDDGIVNGDVYVDNNGALRGIGIVNGTIFVDGGTVAPGFSHGTISADNFILGPGSELVLEVSLNSDGSINTDESDSIVVDTTTGILNLQGGLVTFELSSIDEENDPLETILSTGKVLSFSDLFESSENEVVIFSYELTDPSGSISDKELDQRVEVVSFEKNDCKKDGWKSLFRYDETAVKNEGDCIQYVNTGK